MNEKLKLDLDGLCVETFAAQEAPVEGGTVHANEEAASNNPSCRTACFTTPCCPETVTCPTG
ncbi:MAG: hypothetical protein ACJ8J0_06630 [Longimicrobiaceae bacterium]